jgi:uncharacterized protein YcaQ
VLELSRAEARRVALQAQLLTGDRPTDLLETVRQLGLLQLDPTSAIAPSADLVLWSRLGSSYSPEDRIDAVNELSLVELRGALRHPDEAALHLAEMAAWPGVGDDVPAFRLGQEQWVEDNTACRLDILERLRADGPLPQRELPDSCVRPWKSSGWNNNRNVTMMLDMLVQRGEVAVAGRRGRDKLWDLAERIYPEDPGLNVEEAADRRAESRLRSLGIARAKGPAQPHEPVDVGEIGEPAVVEGVRGEWRVDPALLDQTFTGRTALLSPFDRLLHERKRMIEIFEFDYVLEMYKPAEKRRWGYYALPILYDDRLVGKLDAKADRDAGVLEVYAVHQDVPFTDEMTAAVDQEIADLARWLELEVERPD